jgi:glycosyltransferase involved in cell wall biosynthesis
MACEVPVIASDIPNMREWIEDGINGFLTPMNSGMLAEALRRAYATGSKLPAVGRLAREKVLDDESQGTFESSLRVAERSYEELLRRKA